MTAHVLAWALSELRQRRRVALATVLTTSGSVPGKTGARLAMCSDQHRWVGTVGGAGLEKNILQRCKTLLAEATEPAAEVLTFGLNKGAKGYEVTPLDSLCGGRVTISIEVMMPLPHVYIMGGGHCGEAIAAGLSRLQWSYSIHDTRPEFVEASRYPDAVERSSTPVSSMFEGESMGKLSRFSDILLLGHDWNEDQERLLALLHLAHAEETALNGEDGPRIGVIGSRSKWQAFENACLASGLPQALLDQVICPIGLSIGAQTPEEIAVAVVAQIMAAHKGVEPLQPTWRSS
jgi:xanthine dehydrogenase accessory factor